jgi:2,4-diaminopentanoate dehydrogenase
VNPKEAEMKYRVIQWATGNVGRRALRAIIEHPEMELVGVYVHSAAKVGKDAAELCGLGQKTGILATNKIDEILSLKPDCINYSALIPRVEELERFLESGINVVGTAGYILGTYLAEGARERLDAAGKRGNATLYGSGLNPGVSNILALVGTSMCDRVHSVSVTESVDVTDYASPETWALMGWGKPLGEQGDDASAKNVMTRVLLDACDMTAEALGIRLDDRKPEVTYAVTKEDLDVPAGRFPKNTVAGQKMTYHGMVKGRSVVRQNIVYKVRGPLEPDWFIEHGYVMEVEGEPSLKIKMQLRKPQVDGVNRERTHMDSGMVGTAMPAVNAIPLVCRAAPGVRRVDELPLITGRGLLF